MSDHYCHYKGEWELLLNLLVLAPTHLYNDDDDDDDDDDSVDDDDVDWC